MRAELYRIERAGPGALSVMARPRGGDWLVDEIHAWQEAGVDIVVSLLTAEEQAELGLDEEAALSEQRQLVFRSFPIPDCALPPNRVAAEHMVDEIVEALNAEKHVAVHCRMGIGRSAMMTAAALVALGDTPQRAFDRIQAARGLSVPDTPEQRRWSSSTRSAGKTRECPHRHLRTRPSTAATLNRRSVVMSPRMRGMNGFDAVDISLAVTADFMGRVLLSVAVLIRMCSAIGHNPACLSSHAPRLPHCCAYGPPALPGHRHSARRGHAAMDAWRAPGCSRGS